MSETGIWDTCEHEPKIGQTDGQHGGLRAGRRAGHDVSRSAGEEESNTTETERDGYHGGLSSKHDT